MARGSSLSSYHHAHGLSKRGAIFHDCAVFESDWRGERKVCLIAIVNRFDLEIETPGPFAQHVGADKNVHRLRADADVAQVAFKRPPVICDAEVQKREHDLAARL